MRIHFPELYEAHRLRSPEFLIKLQKQFPQYDIKTGVNLMAGRRKAAPTQADKLLNALKFVSVAIRDDDEYQSFVRLARKQALTFNGQMAASHPIDEELNLCPQLKRLKSALDKCGKSLVISETPANQLSIKGDKLRALVPCVTSDKLPDAQPDERVCDLTDTIKYAFAACNKIADENAEKFQYASVLLQGNTCTATSGASLVQVWHGINLPPMMALPKIFTAAVCKQSEVVTGFGFTWGDDGRPKSVTIYFEGGAWIKTQCYQDEWPIAQAESILNVASNPKEITKGLVDAVAAVAEFSDDDWITFGDDQVMSHNSDNTGAQYEVKGLQAGKKFNGKFFKNVAPFIEKIDLTTYDDRAFFTGVSGELMTRGCIIGYKA